MIDFLVQNAGTSSTLAGIAWIVGSAALIIFFVKGGIFGRINDAVSVFQFLFLIPVALALHRLLSAYSPVLSLSVVVVGIAAMLVFAALQVLLVLGRVSFEQTFRIVLALGGIVGLWWLVTSVLALNHGVLPAGLAWVGIVAGVSDAIVLIGYWMGGQEHPLAAAGFLANAASVSMWALWLGRVLAQSLVL